MRAEVYFILILTFVVLWISSCSPTGCSGAYDRSDPHDSRLEAIESTGDQKVLYEAFLNDDADDIKALAFEKITAPSLLLEIIRTEWIHKPPLNESYYEQAIGKIEDEDILYEIVLDSYGSYNAKCEALKKIKDNNILYGIFMSYSADYNIRAEAVKKLENKDKDFLLSALLNADRSLYGAIPDIKNQSILAGIAMKAKWEGNATRALEFIGNNKALLQQIANESIYRSVRKDAFFRSGDDDNYYAEKAIEGDGSSMNWIKNEEAFKRIAQESSEDAIISRALRNIHDQAFLSDFVSSLDSQRLSDCVSFRGLDNLEDQELLYDIYSSSKNLVYLSSLLTDEGFCFEIAENTNDIKILKNVYRYIQNFDHLVELTNNLKHKESVIFAFRNLYQCFDADTLWDELKAPDLSDERKARISNLIKTFEFTKNVNIDEDDKVKKYVGRYKDRHRGRISYFVLKILDTLESEEIVKALGSEPKVSITWDMLSQGYRVLGSDFAPDYMYGEVFRVSIEGQKTISHEWESDFPETTTSQGFLTADITLEELFNSISP